jgi:DNA polymerase III subunit epsilon
MEKELIEKLNLERPIIFFDLETTGKNINVDQIVELAVCKIHPDGKVEKKEKRFCPTIPIEDGAVDVHGITNDDVINEPKFSSVAKSIKDFFEGCDIAGYNSNEFDVPILLNEFERAGMILNISDVVFIDILKLERKLNSNKLSDTYKRYTGKVLEDAHAALADTDATVEIFTEQLKRFESNNIREVDDFIQGENRRVDLSGKIYEVGGEWYWNIGKHRDKPIRENIGYIKWAMSSDFPKDTKEKLKEYLEERL